MKKFEEFISEGKQVGILYYYISNEVILEKILSDLTIKDNLERGYISFSRNGIGISGRGAGYLRFVLDGDKISDKYKIKPDSLARTLGSKEKATDKEGKLLYRSPENRQQEERIYTSQLNIKTYLLHIQITQEYFDSNMTKNALDHIQNMSPIKIELVESFKPIKC
jgi:hypothetical protein